MNNVKYCPICTVKKFIHLFQINNIPENSYGNGVALTPPMGWSSWNLFREKISEKLIKEIADAMNKSGLSAKGYKYVNIDDCWQSSERDQNGRLQADAVSFPSGIKSLAGYVNSLGLKLGIYSSNGTLTCEDYPASLHHERTDAETFAEWGIEYFKYDFCHNKPVPYSAPFITKLNVSSKDGEEITTVYAEDAVLTGNARLIKCDDVDGGYYVKGLSSSNGHMLIDFNVPSSGRYYFTFTIKKAGLQNKFMVVLINDLHEYHVDVPGTKSPTPEGKIQFEVDLQEGRNSIKIYNPIGSKADSAAFQYINMGKELARATKKYAEKTGEEEKPIVYSICEWGLNRPWRWGRQAGNLWRTTPDIRPSWASILAIYIRNMTLAKYAGPGGWNDPDMLEVGNGKLTYEENKSHFSLWCMMASPLILGNDVRTFIKPDGTVDETNRIYKILTNEKLISIDQDPLGIPCSKINRSLTLDILVRPLADNKAALCVFNRDNKPVKVTVPVSVVSNTANVNLIEKPSYSVVDCWSGKAFHTDSINAEPEGHGVEVFIIE